jgi:hypothetical protein
MKYLLTIILWLAACSQEPAEKLDLSYRVIDQANAIPVVLSTIPFKNNITINFSNTINQSTIVLNSQDNECRGNIQLSEDKFTTCVMLSPDITYEDNNTKITISSQSSLKNSTFYFLKITTDIASANGKKIASPYSYDFETSP